MTNSLHSYNFKVCVKVAWEAFRELVLKVQFPCCNIDVNG